MNGIIQNLQKLYEAGEHSRCLQEATQQIHRFDMAEHHEGAWTPEELSELWAIRAWCEYRIGEGAKDFAAAKESAMKSGTLRGDECLAQIAGVEGDDAELERIARKRPGSAGVANATLLRGKDAKSKISHDLVDEIAQNFGKPEHGVTGANILQNAARFMLEKSRGQRDLLDAAAYLGKAITLYGEKHFHHRAAASNWSREVYEKLGRPNAAFQCALDSFGLWSIAAHLEPGNEKYKKNLASARGHLARLARFAP